MRVRSGFVSNSSSSSFVLVEKKNAERSVELFGQYVNNPPVGDDFNTASKRAGAIGVFTEKAKQFEAMTPYEMSCHFAYVMWEFENFYKTYLPLHKNGVSLSNKEDYRVDDYHDQRQSFLSAMRMYSMKKYLKPLLLKMKAYIEEKTEWVEEDGEFFSDYDSRDFYFLREDYNRLGEEWTSNNPNAVLVWFASDDGDENEANVRSLIFGFCDYCSDKGIECLVTDNS